jgi:anti-sigma factor ChrR (cupin superfamily)
MFERARRLRPGDLLVALMAEEGALAVLDSERRERMRERVMDGSCSALGMHVVRAAAGEWQPLLPGVAVKYLQVDRDADVQTALWRLAPGAQIPPHTHRLAEECLVLDGDVQHAGIEFRAGDFLLSEAGSPHGAFVSACGALLMIRGERVPSAGRIRSGLARID